MIGDVIHPGRHNDPRSVRSLFLSTAKACTTLMAKSAVGSAWDLPSVLPHLTVGGLVGHLSRGILQVEWFLDAKPPAVAPIMVGAAVHRHVRLAVLHALARRELDTAEALRVL